MTRAEEYAKGTRRYLAGQDIPDIQAGTAEIVRHTMAERLRDDAEWSLKMSISLVEQSNALKHQAESILDQARIYRDDAVMLGIEVDRLPILPRR